MPMIRLMPEGKSQNQDVIEDLDLHTVPNVGDFIVIEDDGKKSATYEVKARHFYVGSVHEASAEKERILLEVRDRKPGKMTVTEL